jgi:hypothetical protein
LRADASRSDYDNDGMADLGVFRPSTAQWFIVKSKAGAYTTTFGAQNTDVPIQGDFDGDGITDLAVYRPSSSNSSPQWLILQSTVTDCRPAMAFERSAA